MRHETAVRTCSVKEEARNAYKILVGKPEERNDS
jgi:hypothetical protein